MSFSRRITRLLTPYPLQIFFLRPKPNAVRQAQVRRDVVKLRVGDKVFLEVYWKDVERGWGPAVILNVEGYEIVKFDCFGDRRGHFHIQVMEWRRLGEQRLQLPEPSREQQIDRSVFELRTNSQWFLDHHPLPRVRNTKIDPGRMIEATEKARDILRSYARKCARGSEFATTDNP